MQSTPFLLAGTLVALFFAGCLGDGTTSGQDAVEGAVRLQGKSGSKMALDLSEDFKLEMNDCIEGGGVSLYNMEEGSPGPANGFNRTSISDDTGYPKVASYGQPIPEGGATTGIWHTSVICKSYVFNGVPGKGALEWGWVGVRVQPPEWDTSGIKRQYFVADFSVSDGEIVKALQGSMDLHASRNLNTEIRYLDPAETMLYTALDDEDHGIFETYGKMKDYRDMELEPWRFWMLVASGDMHGHAHEGADAEPMAAKFRPISFDIQNFAESPVKHRVVDGTAMLSHTRTDAHGTGPAGAQGNVGGLTFEGFNRVITLGPQPEITFDDTWRH